mmetsp:Transcript_20080/g.64152  ORF Transcript_20080/g.64152 Transcript_20080/m.64152 type:complete len:304 (+) Transcript_20080:807-1718(+)
MSRSTRSFSAGAGSVPFPPGSLIASVRRANGCGGLGGLGGLGRKPADLEVEGGRGRIIGVKVRSLSASALIRSRSSRARLSRERDSASSCIRGGSLERRASLAASREIRSARLASSSCICSHIGIRTSAGMGRIRKAAAALAASLSAADAARCAAASRSLASSCRQGKRGRAAEGRFGACPPLPAGPLLAGPLLHARRQPRLALEHECLLSDPLLTLPLALLHRLPPPLLDRCGHRPGDVRPRTALCAAGGARPLEEQPALGEGEGRRRLGRARPQGGRAARPQRRGGGSRPRPDCAVGGRAH